MKIILHKNILKKITHKEKNLGFVPTMGSIHIGHISLVKKSQTQCNKTIVSIFINKPQFNNSRDYLKYPRTLNKDISMLKKVKVDYLYLPKTRDIYPSGPNRKIKMIPLSKILCGKFRPNHFKGVIDVIDRFIKIIKPKKIFFGEKDMQQLKLIDHFINKNHRRIKVIGCKTIREKNGIALSSRNFLLSSDQKIIASKIYRLILRNKIKLLKKKISLKTIKNEIVKIGADKIDYLTMLDINRMIKPYKKIKKYKIFVAYYLKTVRLIDNI